jgi:hypothetical protein
MSKKILTNTITILALLFIVENVYSDEASTDGPKWEIGEKWKVRTWLAKGGISSDREPTPVIRKGREWIANFEVVGIVSTADFNVPYLPINLEERTKDKYKNMPKEGYQCYKVEVIFPVDGMGFQRRYLLYYRTDTGNLIRVLDNSIRQDGSIKNFPTDFPIDPNGPNLDADRECPVFSFPDFRVDTNDFSSEDVFSKDDPNWIKRVDQKVSTQKLKNVQGKEYTEHEIVMCQQSIAKKKGGKDEIRYETKVVQKWRAGEPWWREMKKYEDGKLVYEAELITEK